MNVQQIDRINEGENNAAEEKMCTKREPFNSVIYYINKTIQDIKMAIINTIALAKLVITRYSRISVMVGEMHARVALSRINVNANSIVR